MSDHTAETAWARTPCVDIGLASQGGNRFCPRVYQIRSQSVDARTGLRTNQIRSQPGFSHFFDSCPPFLSRPLTLSLTPLPLVHPLCSARINRTARNSTAQECVRCVSPQCRKSESYESLWRKSDVSALCNETLWATEPAPGTS
jgi:hypothetical protein